MRSKKIINYGYCLDMTPNSQNWLTKKCIVISWENYWFSDLGSERVNGTELNDLASPTRDRECEWILVVLIRTN